jgi:hypothetical protein
MAGCQPEPWYTWKWTWSHLESAANKTHTPTHKPKVQWAKQCLYLPKFGKKYVCQLSS